MQRRAIVHEAAFVLVAAILNGPDWVLGTGRLHGHPRTVTVLDDLPYLVTDSQSLRHVVALLAPIEAERKLLGEASFLGQPKIAKAVDVLRNRFWSGLEAAVPTEARYGDLNAQQSAQIDGWLADARDQAATLVREHARGIERLADVMAVHRLTGRALGLAIREALDAD